MEKIRLKEEYMQKFKDLEMHFVVFENKKKEFSEKN